MSNGKDHIIKHQVIDLATNSDDGFVIQQEISRLTQEYLNRQMELLFDRLVPDDKWIYIDKLGIDLENIDRIKLESEFVDKTLQAIEKAIRNRLAERSETEIKVVDNPARLVIALIHFLEKGYLPWNFPVSKHDRFEKELIELFSDTASPAVSGNDLSGFYIQQLKKVLGSPIPARRFIDQFSDEVVESLGLLFLAGQIDLNREWSALKSFIQRSGELSKTNFSFWWKETKLIFITGLAQKADAEAVYSIARQIIKSLFLQQGEKIFQVPAASPLLQQVLNETAGDKKLMEEYLGNQDHTFIQESKIKEISKNKPGEEKPGTDTDEKIKVESKTELQPDENEGIYITNAGLVIVTPFLFSFFNQLGLVNEKQLTERSKAICLLQYLSGYKEPWKEYDLPLNKILCGLDPDERIETDMVISDPERSEADALLGSIIQHWTLIRNTSVVGLQESFLQRNGKLSKKNGEWLLQVEQKSFDMVLEHLPWSYSIIKLPWMKQALRTEWVH